MRQCDKDKRMLKVTQINQPRTEEIKVNWLNSNSAL